MSRRQRPLSETRQQPFCVAARSSLFIHDETAGYYQAWISVI